MKAGVYKLTHLCSGKFYIGSSLDLANRRSFHLSGKSRCVKLAAAIKKHGADQFRFDVIEAVDVSGLEKAEAGRRLLEREQFYLDGLRPFGRRGFNISESAYSAAGTRRTEEQIERYRRAAKKRGYNPKALAAARAAWMATGMNEEQRAAVTRRVRREAAEKEAGIYCYENRAKPWWAHIKVDGKRRSLGYYSSRDEALAARKRAEADFWFSSPTNGGGGGGGMGGAPGNGMAAPGVVAPMPVGRAGVSVGG